LSAASFSLEASVFKGIVAAYSAVYTDYFWHFEKDGVSFRCLDSSHVSMILGEIYPNNYRLSGEPFYVRPILGASIEQIKTAIKGAKKGQEIRFEVKGGKMSIGVPPATITVGEVAPLEMQDIFEPPIPRVRGEVHLRFVLSEFRRIVKAAKDQKSKERYMPSPVFESIAFDILDTEGRIFFFNEQKSVVKLTRYLDWILEMRGRGFAAYSLGMFANYLVPGMSDVVGVDYDVQGVVRISYDFNDGYGHYKISYWIAPKTMEKADIDKLLEEKPVTRRLLFRLSGIEDVKSFANMFAASYSVAAVSEFAMGLLDDLWLYWMDGGRGYLMVPKRWFEVFEFPGSRMSGVFGFKGFIGWFKDVERFECFLEMEPEEAMVVVASGPKIAPREIRSSSLQHTLEVPEVKGTVILRGSGAILSDVMDDALAAEESFIVLVSAPFEISVVGRDMVYYRASIPTDSFQSVEEDHAVVLKSWFRALKECFRHFDVVSFGKSDSNIFLDLENPIGRLRVVLGQYAAETEYVEAERVYKEEFVTPPTPPPEVKPLTVPPAPPLCPHDKTELIVDRVEDSYWIMTCPKCKRRFKADPEKKKFWELPKEPIFCAICGKELTKEDVQLSIVDPATGKLIHMECAPIGAPYREEKPEIVSTAEEALKELEGL